MSSKRTSKSANSRTGTYIAAPEQSLLDAGPSTSQLPLVPARFQPMMSGQGGAKRTMEDAELEGEDDEEEEEEGVKGKNANKRNATSTGRRKISIQYIDDKSKRHVSFTKRKSGLMKKAFELSTLTGTQCLVVVVSETGAVYTFGTPGLRPIVEVEQGKALIQASLRGELTEDDAPMDDNEADNDNGNEGDYPVPSYDFGYPTAAPSLYPPDSLLPALPPLPPLSAFTLPTTTSYTPISTQTPYERAQAEHAQAFATYQARYSQPSTSSDNAFASTSTDLSALGGGNAASRAVTSRAAVYGAHSFTDAARSWNPPVDEHGNGLVRGRDGGYEELERRRTSVGMNEGRVSGAGGEVVKMEDRRRLLREEAERAVNDAKERRIIPVFLKAHTLALRSQLAIPPPMIDPSLPLHGIELTMQQFGKVCESNGFDQPHQLQLATRAFVDVWLPSQNASCRATNEARQHLTLFFDFLEGHSLVTSTEHAILISFPTPPSHNPASTSKSASASNSSSVSPGAEDDERSGIVGGLWDTWVKEVREKFNEKLQDASVEGWFEIYRVRGNFVVLKEKDLKGDSSINSLLSPFKVRVPKSLSPHLKIDDAVCLSIRRVADRTAWVPTAFVGFMSKAGNDEEESDIDPLQYRTELERLLALEEPLDEAGEEDVRFNREVFGQLTRAKEMLEQGELSDD